MKCNGYFACGFAFRAHRPASVVHILRLTRRNQWTTHAGETAINHTIDDAPNVAVDALSLYIANHVSIATAHIPHRWTFAC